MTLKNRLIPGVLLSALIHAAAAAALYGYFFVQAPAPIVAELDLSMAPATMALPNAGGGRAPKPVEKWTAPEKGLAPAPAQTVAPAPAAEEMEETPCIEPCPDKGGTGGGGTGLGEGVYVPASQTSRQPRWAGNFISSRDYPAVARQAGKDGRVIVSVWIDDTGRVRDVRLLKGAYEALNEVALRKVREARFTPAYDAHGRPVACQILLPIRFELK